MAIDTYDKAAGQALLAAAEADTSPIAKKFHADAFSNRIRLVIWLLITPLLFALSVWQLITAVQTDVWGDFWWAGIGALAAGYLIASVYALVTPANPMASLAYSALREVAESGDERLAPIVTAEPTRLSDDEIRSNVVIWNRVWRIRAATTTWSVLSGFEVPLLVVSPLIWAVAYPYIVDNLGLFLLIALTILMGIIGFVIVIARKEIGYTIAADADGIRWRTYYIWWPQNLVRWDQVRTFIRLRVRNKAKGHDARTFVLDAGNTILVWGVNPLHMAAERVFVSDDMKNTWDLLEAVVSTRSGLPLRDLTACSHSVTRAVMKYPNSRLYANWLERKLVTSADEPDEIAIPGLARASASLGARVNPRRRRLAIVLSCIPLAVFVALYIVGAIVQLSG